MSIKDKTYEDLRTRIITNAFSPGEKLSEKELMQEYDIGRTPLREIFFQLREEGFIDIIPQVGTQVSTIDIQEIRNIIEVRRWLEQLVGQLAAERISPEQLAQLKSIMDKVDSMDHQNEDAIDALNQLDAKFHAILYQATQNKTIQELLPKLLTKMGRFWYYLGFQVTEYLNHFDDLRDLIDALEKGDKSRARQILDVHIDHFVERVKAQIL